MKHKTVLNSSLLFMLFLLVCVFPGRICAQDVELNIPETIPVQAGSFMMGMEVYDGVERPNSINFDGLTGATPFKESPAHEVTMSSYYIGKYEVTNAQYAEFVDAGGYDTREYWLIDPEYYEDSETGWYWRQETGRTAPRYTVDYTTGETAGWDLSKNPYWLDDPYSNQADTPVCGVNWYEAYAYCKWLSSVTGETYRLPTEAEWEYAARGPQSNIFPWGDEYLTTDQTCGAPGSGAMCNCNKVLAVSDDTVGARGKATPGGSYPESDSYFGVCDMAGNVTEWTADWFQMLYYPERINNGEVTDPTGPSVASPPMWGIAIPPFWPEPCRTVRSQGFSKDPKGTSYTLFIDATYAFRCAYRMFMFRFDGTYFTGLRVVKEEN